MRDVSLHDLSSDEIESVRQAIGRDPDRWTKVARVDSAGGTVRLATERVAQLGLSPDPHVLRESFNDIVSVQMRLYRGRSGNEWRVGSFTDGEGRTVVLLGR